MPKRSIMPLTYILAARSMPDASGCVLWTGAIGSEGYGQIGVKVGGVWCTRRAHRISYELARGPIPVDLQLNHLCRNRHCINPDHLEPVRRRKLLQKDRGADAARLCALIYQHGRVLGRFAITLRDARRKSDLLPTQLEVLLGWAIQSGWIRRWPSNTIELTAAGMFVAKDVLDLPR